MLKYLAWNKWCWLTLLCMAFALNSHAQLKAGFTVSSPSSCTFLTDNFTDKTTGGTTPYTYSWTLGNGNTSLLQNPSAIYVSPKTYTVKLVVTDKSGKKDSATKTVTIFSGPTASFKANPSIGCPPFAVTFTDQSVKGSAAIAQWIWDYGDGNIDTIRKPNPHSFANPGNYSVSLYLTDANGCTGAFHDPAPIVASQLPNVDFTSSLSGGCVPPVSIAFAPKATAASKIKNYFWDFGDGGTDTTPNPKYAYGADGSFAVTLKVTDSLGCVGSATKPSYIVIGKPVANFAVSNGSGCAPLAVGFTDKSTGLSPRASFHWDFGDGSTSAAINPTHTFPKGTYTVTYSVKNPSGCGDTVIKSSVVNVSAGYQAKFIADTVLCSLPYTSTFTNTSGANTSVVKWDFGDPVPGKSFSGQSSPKYTYITPSDTGGIFSISLTVVDNNGCMQTVTKHNYIHAKRTTIAIACDSGGCIPFLDSIQPVLGGIDSVTKWSWTFGDGSTSNLRNPVSHYYPDTGYYNISLNINTVHSCSVTASTTVGAGMPPTASFIGGPYTGCLNTLRHMHFYSTTNNPPAIIKATYFAWSLTDAEKAYGPDALFTGVYTSGEDAKPGKYDLTLLAANHGCVNKTTKKNIVTVTGPWAHFLNTTDITCTADSTIFTDDYRDVNQFEYYFGDKDSSKIHNPIHDYASGAWTPYMIVKNDTSGCTDTFTLAGPIIIPQIFTVVVQDSSTKGCAPLKTWFNVSSSEQDSFWISYGDGDSDNVSYSVLTTGFTHIYTKKGNYRVVVRAYTFKKCKSTVILPDTIKVGGPAVSFLVNKTQGCTPLKVLLRDNSPRDNTIVSKIFNMGDGHGFNLTSDTASYTYTLPPIDQNAGYNISLVALDNSGCTNSYQANVKPRGPVAAYDIDSNYTCTNVLYAFSPTNIGIGPFTYAWNMGDGSTTAVDTPLHTYSNGYYRVRLQMTDAGGCIDTTSTLLHVHFVQSTPDFTTDTANGNCPPFRVHFTDKSKFPFGGYHGFEWDFGDGSPHSFVESPDKVYYLPGSYNVTLKITDSLGCVDSFVKKDLITIKGPSGNLSISSLNGCQPLTVHFNATSANATKFSMDMGDGNVLPGDTATHTYTLAGKYVPLLYLSDNAGCSYSLPGVDTVKVYPLPQPDFTYNTNCSGLPTLFYDASLPKAAGIASWHWNFGDSLDKSGIDNISSNQNPSHVYKKNGFYKVTLAVTNNNGCSATLIKKVLIGNIAAQFTAPDTGCVGAPVPFKDASVSDTTIRSWTWYMGDNTSSSGQDVAYAYPRKGIYTVTLVIENNKGCADTAIKRNYITIGDTTAPPPPFLYRVSVADDSTVEVDFSKYTGIDFRAYVISIKDNNGNLVPVSTINDINDTAAVVTGLHTQTNVYCFAVQSMNICGHASTLSATHCTINLKARPGIEKALLKWTPYVGWDVDHYGILRASSKPPIFSAIGSVSGDSLSYADTTVVCYKPYVYRVVAFEKGGTGQTSISDTSSTLPIHIPKLPAPTLAYATVPDNKNVMVAWDALPATQVKRWIVEKSFDGIRYNFLNAPLGHNILSTTDSQADVQNHSYYYRVNLMDSCGDIGPYSNIGKTILLQADTTAGLQPVLHWTSYKSWPEGVQYYDIEYKDANGNFNSLAHATTANDTSFTDYSTYLNGQKDYCYRVTAHRNGPPSSPDQNINTTSVSNESCLQPKYRIFIPDAFTPNGDGINDSFLVNGLFINDFHIRIYDRWGSKIFESYSLKNGWDGRYKDSAPVSDAYEYLIEVTGADGKIDYLNGTVTVLP